MMMMPWVERRLGGVVASTGRESRANCPFCYARVGSEDTKRHLYVSLQKPVAHCFRCGWKGHHVSLIMSVDGCSYTEALVLMEHVPSDICRFEQLHSPSGLVQGQTLAVEPDGFLAFDGVSPHREGRAVRRYLLKRNVSDRLIHSAFGWVPGTHRAWMLVDANWWQGRLIIRGEPKYISPPWPRGDSLWNAAALSKVTTRPLVICEGVFSAIAVGPRAIALCGKGCTDLQAERIVSSTRSGSIMVMLDADATSNAHAIADKLVEFGYTGSIRVQYMLSGDPAEGQVGKQIPWTWESKVLAGLQA